MSPGEQQKKRSDEPPRRGAKSPKKSFGHDEEALNHPRISVMEAQQASLDPFDWSKELHVVRRKERDIVFMSCWRKGASLLEKHRHGVRARLWAIEEFAES